MADEEQLKAWADTVESLHQTIIRMEDGLREIRDIANRLLTVRQVQNSEPEKQSVVELIKAPSGGRSSGDR